MGIAVSRYSDLTNNELLIRFCSTEVLSPNEPFWNQLLAFNINPPNSMEEQLIFDSSTESLLQTFLMNNPQSGNLGSLVQVFITRAIELLASPSTDNAMLAWQTFNALFVIRCVVKYLVEMVPEYQLGQHLDVVPGHLARAAEDHNTPDDSPTGKDNSKEQPDTINNKTINNESRLEMLCDALVGLICDVTVTDNTYYLHLECINTYLILMSTYMFASTHAQPMGDSSFIYRTIYQGRYSLHAPLLVRTLLTNVSAMHRAPDHRFNCHTGQGSLVINIASGLWNMLTFNSSSTRHTIFTQPPVDRTELTERLLKEHPVANQSCLLLLALTNHCINDNNLYRRALFACEDTTETTSTTPQKDKQLSQLAPPKIEMAAIHRALCATAACEHFTLLLYALLHSCAAYRRHVLANQRIDELILPILECLYDARENNSHHIYMSLIVLLILTEDDALTRNVHLISIKNPVWYTERALTEISLGGLMVLVIIRTVQYNIVRVRDKYLHKNCLAAIANMSSEFRNLHPYVAQRLISLYETLSKRRARLCKTTGGVVEANGVEVAIKTEDKTEDEAYEHVMDLDEVLWMLLEILNSCLSKQLQNNLNLVYALLHKKQLFQDNTQPIMNNIKMVIGYFSSRLQRVQDGAGGGDLGVTEVLACIKKGAEQWSNDRLKKFPELKFRYVEEDIPEEFFTPYVWGLAVSCGVVHWQSECSTKALRDLTIAC